MNARRHFRPRYVAEPLLWLSTRSIGHDLSSPSCANKLNLGPNARSEPHPLSLGKKKADGHGNYHAIFTG
jgi:hypothetical protein